MAGFEILFDNLSNLGFFTTFLPVVLFIAIYYGLLMKTKAISEEADVNGAASVALSLITVFGIYLFVPATFFPQFFSVLSIILLGLLSVLMIMGMLGVEFSTQGVDSDVQIVAIIGVVIILLVVVPFVASQFMQFNLASYWNFLLTFVMLFILMAVMYSLTRD